MEHKRGNLKKGFLLNLISLGITFLTSFLLTPIILSKLGNAGFGMWVLIQSFSGYYGLVNLGLVSALQRSVTHDLAQKNMQSLQQTVGTAVLFLTLTGSVVLLAAIGLGGPIAHFFEVLPAEISVFRMTLIFCAVAVVTDFYGGVNTTFFSARERFDLLNGLGICRQLLQAGGILFVTHYSPSTNAMALVVCCVSSCSLIASWFIARRLIPEISISSAGASLSRLKELLHYGGSTVLLTVTNIVRLRLGNVVIAKTSGLIAVSVYSVAASLVLNMNSVMAASLNVLNPRFTRLNALSNTSELQKLYRGALFGSSLMACWMGLMIILFGERFILFWVGAGMIGAVPVLKILTLAYTVALAQAPGWNLMFALSKHHFIARVSIVEAVAILILGLWLASIYGPAGFACATLIAMLLTKLIIQPPYAASIANLSLRQYLEPMCIPFMVGVGIYLLSQAIQIEEMLRSHGPVLFLTLATLCSILFVGSVWLFARKQKYADAILSRIKSKTT